MTSTEPSERYEPGDPGVDISQYPGKVEWETDRPFEDDSLMPPDEPDEREPELTF